MEGKKKDLLLKMLFSRRKLVGEDEAFSNEKFIKLIENNVSHLNEMANWTLKRGGEPIDTEKLSLIHPQSMIEAVCEDMKNLKSCMALPFGDTLYEIEVVPLGKKIKVVTNKFSTVKEIITAITEHCGWNDPENYALQANELFLYPSTKITTYYIDEEITISLVKNASFQSILVLFPGTSSYQKFRFRNNSTLLDIVTLIGREKGILGKLRHQKTFVPVDHKKY